MSVIIPKTSEHSRITVGIVTYNSAGHIQACLDSVAHNLRDAVPTIIILDNSSTDNTLDIIQRHQKKIPFHITVIPQKNNLGYAWGANRICEIAQTEWLCLINPDAKIKDAVFIHAKNLVRRNPTCGVIGGIIHDPEGNVQECGGVFPTPSMAVWDWCGLRHLFPRPNWSTTLRLDIPPDAHPRKIDYPTGAFWIMRREVYRRIGPFDERFFLYFEETDFCKRAKEKGWPSFIHPGIRIEHVKGASFVKLPNNLDDDPDRIDPLAIYFESLIKYLEKHFKEWCVKNAVGLIYGFLKFRKWIRKDEKSKRILAAFEAGKSKADKYRLDNPTG